MSPPLRPLGHMVLGMGAPAFNNVSSSLRLGSLLLNRGLLAHHRPHSKPAGVRPWEVGGGDAGTKEPRKHRFNGSTWVLDVCLDIQMSRNSWPFWYSRRFNAVCVVSRFLLRAFCGSLRAFAPKTGSMPRITRNSLTFECPGAGCVHI